MSKIFVFWLQSINSATLWVSFVLKNAEKLRIHTRLESLGFKVNISQMSQIKQKWYLPFWNPLDGFLCLLDEFNVKYEKIWLSRCLYRVSWLLLLNKCLVKSADNFEDFLQYHLDPYIYARYNNGPFGGIHLLRWQNLKDFWPPPPSSFVEQFTK